GHVVDFDGIHAGPRCGRRGANGRRLVIRRGRGGIVVTLLPLWFLSIIARNDGAPKRRLFKKDARTRTTATASRATRGARSRVGSRPSRTRAAPAARCR